MVRKEILFMVLAFGCVVTNGLALEQKKRVLDYYWEFYYNFSPFLNKEEGFTLVGVGIGLEFFCHALAPGDKLNDLLRQIDERNQLPQGPIVDCDGICRDMGTFDLYEREINEVYKKRQAGYMQVLSDYSESKYKKSESSKYSDYVTYVEERVLDNQRHIERQVCNAREAYVKSIAVCLFNKSFNNFMHEINEKNY